ncbi:MAG: putative metal-dependent hydrolase [Fibrobacterota bacterium]|nr:putative metal-dependent hydrolase [Fibrobacterota bacterium]
MESLDLQLLRFPVGTHTLVTRFDRASVDASIAEIENFPTRLRARVTGLSDADLDKRYRPGGWTVRQVVYHLADSHTHIYIRFKWALTEEKPLIKAYQEDRWAELPDSRLGNTEIPLRGLESIHARWTSLMRTMDDAAFGKTFVHPETGLENVLFDRVASYVWHGWHHLAHIDLALRV